MFDISALSLNPSISTLGDDGIDGGRSLVLYVFDDDQFAVQYECSVLPDGVVFVYFVDTGLTLNLTCFALAGMLYVLCVSLTFPLLPINHTPSPVS